MSLDLTRKYDDYLLSALRQLAFCLEVSFNRALCCLLFTFHYGILRLKVKFVFWFVLSSENYSRGDSFFLCGAGMRS